MKSTFKSFSSTAGGRVRAALVGIIAGLFHLMAQDAWAQKVTYFHNDLLGSPVATTDATGTVVWKETYRPYGQPYLNSSAAATERIGFSGKPYDRSTGLSYVGARYYDPFVGRFLSIDPRPADDEDVHSLNRYAYANNNPAKHIDPDGHSPVDIAFLTYDVFKLAAAVYQGAGVREAALDVAFSVVGVVVPAPGAGQALKAAKAVEKVTSVSAAVQAAAKGAHPTFKPGPHAGESIPARGPGRDFTAAERADGKRIFNETGCHTCGTRNAGTKHNDPVLDHQPVSALNKEGASQRLYPQCLNCSRDQGLAAARKIREEAN